MATIAVPGVPEQPRIAELDWATDFAKHFVKGKCIGNGSFGEVYLGVDLHTGQTVRAAACTKHLSSGAQSRWPSRRHGVAALLGMQPWTAEDWMAWDCPAPTPFRCHG